MAFSNWPTWLIDKTVYLVPMIFGFAWWFIEVGHVLYNPPQNGEYSEAAWESEWKWMSERKWIVSRLLNDIPLMDIEPLWGAVRDAASPTFDMMGRIQTIFAIIAIGGLLVIVIILKLMGLPPMMGDAIKMIGGAVGLKEVARWGYRALCGGLVLWYALANVFGRKALIQTQLQPDRVLTDAQKYFIEIYNIAGKPPNFTEVYKKDPHSALWNLYQNVALDTKGTYWLVLLVLAVTSVTTLIAGFLRPKPVPPVERQCCEQGSGGGGGDGEGNEDDLPTEGLYMQALLTNAKWSLNSSKDFAKQLFFPICYVLIGIAAYGLPALLLVYCSKGWRDLTGKTLKEVIKNLGNAALFVLISVGLAMFIMNILRYMEQMETLQDYVVGHVVAVLIMFTLLGWTWAE